MKIQRRIVRQGGSYLTEKSSLKFLRSNFWIKLINDCLPEFRRKIEKEIVGFAHSSLK